MNVFTNPSRAEWKALVQRPQLELEYLESAVKNTLNRVRNSGDKALRELTLQFDKVSIDTLQVRAAEIEEAGNSLSSELKDAIKIAASNICRFHEGQRRSENKIETMPGVVCWRKASPISRVGIYIPGGSAPLFSTVLMLGIPASLAGCEEIVLCTPPDRNGNVNPAILFAAHLVGIKRIYRIGGAQAIAAMAYGTETIPKVYKIFGPGNQYVTKAKQMVADEGVAIDMPAGPSEVLVLADDSAEPSFVAADLLSQAEHGEDSQVMLVLLKKELLSEIQTEIITQLDNLPRKDIAAKALASSRVVIIDNLDEAIAFVNEYAPEHLIINLHDTEHAIGKIVNAGSVFVGNFTPEAVGDYASGTNHTLPTNGFAKAYAGVSLDSFVRYITYQRLSKEGIKNIGQVVERMAEAEELVGHKNAVTVRLQKLRNTGE